MMTLQVKTEKHPPEIPTKKDPEKTYPEKMPDTDPSKSNPVNPQSDE